MLKKLELLFKGLVLGLFKSYLRKGRRDIEKVNLAEARKILIIRPEKIGDLFVSLPIVDILKRNYPGLEITLLTSAEAFPLVEGDPRFEKVLIYHKGLRTGLETVYGLQDEQFDIVIDMVGRDSAIFLILGQLISKKAIHIGIGKDRYQDYYDFNYDLRCENTGHVISNSMKLLRAFDLQYTEDDHYAPPYLGHDDKLKADEFLKCFESKGRLIGFNLSAGSSGRVWPDEYAEELVNKIMKNEPDCCVLLIAVSSDRARAGKLREKLGKHVFLIPENRSLNEVSAIIRGLDLLITPDTSLVHIARSFHVPVIGLYTRQFDNYKIWGPYGQQTGQIVSANVDNIYDITPDQVYEEYERMLSENHGDYQCRVK